MQWKLYYKWLYKFGSPKWFYETSGKWLCGLSIVTACLLTISLVWGLAFAPADYLQGNSYRIIFIHVPSAFLAQAIYILMASAAIIYLVWKIKIADMAQAVLAPIGTSFTLLALFTGAVWGKPTWGTWWVWDARLTSMLILLFLYLGLLSLRNAMNNNAAARGCSIMAIVGVVNIPIIKFSVEWWNTLHQGTTLTLTERPSMAIEMLMPLLMSIIGFYLFFTLIFIQRLRIEIMYRERKTSWVRQLISTSGSGSIFSSTTV
ncbi:MAG: heme ABC transporter permease CcmC [Candidatus Endonucleobacter bathymodioli]|uniref:Heme exporter protein C n=1 Tax=Candidatus Endonucleibacter bathymodioli TaxID=539814 RepID=A0AA90SD00_9GAMM|nr:heme ABC transporter permease CcmC [Candidatus Endonucleobacter bathymodioli]